MSFRPAFWIRIQKAGSLAALWPTSTAPVAINVQAYYEAQARKRYLAAARAAEKQPGDDDEWDDEELDEENGEMKQQARAGGQPSAEGSRDIVSDTNDAICT